MFLIFIVMLFSINIEFVKSNTITDFNNGTASGSGSGASGDYNCMDGFRIVVLDSNGNRVSGTHEANIISYSSSIQYGSGKYYITSSAGVKIEYGLGKKTLSAFNKQAVSYEDKKYKAINGTNTFNYYASSYDFGEFLYGRCSGGNSREGQTLNGWLGANDYKNLKEYVRQTGYTCFSDNPADNCAPNQYILVEPLMLFGSSLGTPYELAQKLFDGHYETAKSQGLSAMFRRAATTTFVNQNPSTFNIKTFNGTNDNEVAFNNAKDAFSGAGLGIYRVSDISGFKETPKKGKAKINKVNAAGQLIQGKAAKFKICKNVNGTNCVKVDGKEEFSLTGTKEIDLDLGWYYLIETSAPSTSEVQYQIATGVVQEYNSNGNYAEKIHFEIKSGQTITIKVINKTACEADFDIDSSISNRIKLYQEKYPKFNNLLDFTITNSYEACKVKACSRPLETSCLSGKYGSETFNKDNVACYNETIDLGGKIAYCLTTFDLTDKIKLNPFNIKSGQMPIQVQNIEDAIATVGVLTKQCFVYGGYSGKIYADFKNYVSDVKFNNKSLKVLKNNELVSLSKLTNTQFELNEESTNFYSGNKSIPFYLSPVYAHNGSGEYSENICNDCKFLGYGVISKLTGTGQFKIPFEVDFATGSIFKSSDKDSKGVCSSQLNRELLECENGCSSSDKPITSEYDLKLEFRVIDTYNPFPGYSGTGRNVGTNWCEYNRRIDSTFAIEILQIAQGIVDVNSLNEEQRTMYDINGDGKITEEDASLALQEFSHSKDSTICSNVNKKVTENITNRINSYGVIPSDETRKVKEPKYVITLTPEIIKEIRKYNKKTTYNDYTLKCDNGENCESTFLKEPYLNIVINNN